MLALRPGTPRAWSGHLPPDSCAPSLLPSLNTETAPAAAGAWRSVVGLAGAAACPLARLHDATPASGWDVCSPPLLGLAVRALLQPARCECCPLLCTPRHTPRRHRAGCTLHASPRRATIANPSNPAPPPWPPARHAHKARSRHPHEHGASDSRDRPSVAPPPPQAVGERPRVAPRGGRCPRRPPRMAKHAWPGPGPAPPGVTPDPVALGRVDCRPATAPPRGKGPHGNVDGRGTRGACTAPDPVGGAPPQGVPPPPPVAQRTWTPPSSALAVNGTRERRDGRRAPPAWLGGHAPQRAHAVHVGCGWRRGG